MPIVTEVRFAHPDGALADTLRALSDLEVTVIPEASMGPRRSIYLLRFGEGERETVPVDEVVSVLEADHTVESVELMPVFEREPLIGVAFAPETKLLAPQVTSEGGFVLEARSSRPDEDLRGWYERWLLPSREALHGIWQHARDEGFEFDVIRFREQGDTAPEYAGTSRLTEEQRETLVLAYERGYFAEPRGTSLEDLAAELGISPTAVAGRLKRGMRALVGMTVVSDRSDE
jgi:biotin operon repressor